MGFLDEVGSMLGGSGAAGGSGGIMDVAQHLLSENGGLQGVIDKFQQGGLGEHVASWIGNGQNLPISAEQIQQVLGSDQVAAIAGKLGIDPQQAATVVAQHLPDVVSKLTPNGQVPDASGLLAQGSELLKGLFKS